MNGINMVGVTSPSGQALGISIGAPIADRNNTERYGRTPRNALDLTAAHNYRCEKTEFDVALPYGMLDAWAQFADFAEHIDQAIGERQALDRLMIGFNQKRGQIYLGAPPVPTNKSLFWDFRVASILWAIAPAALSDYQEAALRRLANRDLSHPGLERLLRAADLA